ncbi:MAG: hypothetical protein KF852_06240 [Saprospiraceae bacterium]|nr:hypothetical protein [Saprospiraceae bacterium]
MKAPIIIALLCCCCIAQAGAQDSTMLNGANWSGLVILGTKNLWRGIDFGNATPTVQGLVAFKPSDRWDINLLGITSLTGENAGYASTLNLFVNYTLNKLTLTLDNYYFHGDATNIPTNFWDYKNAHFLEGRIGYALNKFNFTAGYTLYGGGYYSNPVIDSTGATLQNTRGLYLEVQYRPIEQITLTMGGITAASALNFADKAGITNIGFKYTKNLKITDHFSIPVDFQLVVNPSYQNIAPLGLPRVGYGNQRVNFAIMMTLE